MPSYKGYNYVLAAIDIASRRVWAFALKKKTLDAVVRNLKSIVDNHTNQHRILSFRFDNGTEFKNSKMTEWCKEENINMIYGAPLNSEGGGPIERWNETYKQMNKTLKIVDWVSTLNSTVKAYNNKIHRGLKGKTPFEAYQEKMPVAGKVIPLSSLEIDRSLDENTENCYQKGDKVLMFAKRTNNNRINSTESWYRGPWFVVRRNKDNRTYYLIDEDKNQERKCSYRQMKRFTEPTARIRAHIEFEELRQHYFPKWIDEMKFFDPEKMENDNITSENNLTENFGRSMKTRNSTVRSSTSSDDIMVYHLDKGNNNISN